MFDTQRNGLTGPKSFYYFQLPPHYETTGNIDVDFVRTGKDEWEHIRGFYPMPSSAADGNGSGKIKFDFWQFPFFPNESFHGKWPTGCYSDGPHPWQPQKLSLTQVLAKGLIQPMPQGGSNMYPGPATNRTGQLLLP